MATLAPQGRQQYTTSTGAPLAGGLLYTYAAGTTTPLATYSNQAGTVPNANPVVLNSRGEATIFWAAGPYKVALHDAADVPIWTQDDIYPPASAAGLTTTDARLNGEAGTTVGSALVTATGSTSARSLAARAADATNVLDFGADPTGATNSTAAIAAALAAVPANGTLVFPPGVYQLSSAFTIRRSNITVLGYGATLRAPAGTATNVINVGKIDTIGAGDEPWTGIVIRGFTIDGNRSANIPGAADINGWGILTAVISYSQFADLHIINCWVGGAGNEINSNHNVWSNIVIDNCGHDSPTYEASRGYPSFDINSSKYCSYANIVTNGGVTGFRVLDNCWGNSVSVTIHGAANNGLVLNNQYDPANISDGNTITASVYGGSAYNAVSVGPKFRNSTIVATIDGVTGAGVNEIKQVDSAKDPQGNTYVVNMRNIGGVGAIVGGQNGNWTINATQVGTSGAQGDHYAVDVTGSHNAFSLNITDSSPWHTRGVVMRAASSNNTIHSYSYSSLVSPFDDSGTGNHAVLNGVPQGSATDVTYNTVTSGHNRAAGPAVAVVSTTPVTLFTLVSTDHFASFAVGGDDGYSGWADLILFWPTRTPQVVASTTAYGTPPARTYAASGTSMTLSVASGTYNVRVLASQYV